MGRLSGVKKLWAVSGCLLVILTMSACSGSDAQDAEPTPASPTASPSTSDAAGVALRGWPVDDLTCPEPSVRFPKGHPVSFDHVSELVFCPPSLPTVTLAADQDGFIPVMRQLSAPDMKGVYNCPLMPYGGPDKTLVILAASGEDTFRVRIPGGICGGLQPNLTRALHHAHVDVGHALTTF